MHKLFDAPQNLCKSIGMEKLQHIKDLTGFSDAAIGARIGWSQSVVYRVRTGQLAASIRMLKAIEREFPEELDALV